MEGTSIETLKAIETDNESMLALAKRTPALLGAAQALAVYDDATKAQALEGAQGCKAVIAEINATFDDLISDAHQLHAKALAKKKRWFDPVKQAFDIYVKKMTDYEKAELVRKEAEAKAIAEAQEKERQRKIDAAYKAIEKLKATVGNATELRATIEERLENDATVTDEEAQVMRATLATLQAKADTAVEQAQKHEAQVEEAKAPIIADTINIRPEKEDGMAKTKKKKILLRGDGTPMINTKVLMRAIVEGKLPIDPDGIMKWNKAKLEALIQTIDLPGVSWDWDLKISIKANKE